MIAVDLEIPIALEEQIRGQIRQVIARGELRVGEELPSVRQLAADLAVHWNTVARAYRRLQAEGLLVVRRGRGVFVRSLTRAVPRADRETRRRVLHRLRDAFADALLGGLTVAEIRKLVLNELKRWQGPR